MHQGLYIDPAGGKALVAVYAKRWLDNLTHLKPSTLERYRGIATSCRCGVAGSSARLPGRCDRLDFNFGC